MPAGKVHDRITLSLTPVVMAVTLGLTRSPSLTLLLAIAFVFSGLMFGPDLDIHSCQYKRWGWLRWLWLPYRRLIRHRSPLSHGFLIGTMLRLVYVGLWLIPVGLVLGMWIIWSQGQDFRDITTFLPEKGQILGQWAWQYRWELLTIFVGLELGAMGHSFSDWGGSWWKKWQKQIRSPQGRRRKNAPHSPKVRK